MVSSIQPSYVYFILVKEGALGAFKKNSIMVSFQNEWNLARQPVLFRFKFILKTYAEK